MFWRLTQDMRDVLCDVIAELRSPRATERLTTLEPFIFTN